MCGIAGFRSAENNREVARRLLSCLGRRGPDGDAWTEAGSWVLAQTRLAIIDLTDRVSYPMRNEAGNVSLIFNGEIYNFAELRRELERHDHTFRTDCDAEVIVHGWEEWGVELLPKLSGMFAFGILDERSDELVVARDRFGIKPLCVTTRGPFAFASDAIALVEAGLAKSDVDQGAVAEFLAFGYVPPPRTGISGVEHVEPGTALVVGPAGRHVQRWAPPLFARSEDALQPIRIDELDEAFGRAVDRHLVSDVEVGLLLSSGVDSSLILERLATEGRPPVCFTIGFPGAGDYDETAAAASVAARFGAEHHVDKVDLGFQSAVEGVAAAFDGPFADASAVATLAVARLAANRVKVVLSGTGGDDLFAGYYRHRAHLLHPLMRRFPTPIARAIADRSSRRGAERSSTRGLFASYATRLARAGGTSLRGQYLSLVGSGISREALEAVLESSDIDGARERAADRLALGDQEGSRWLRHLRGFECRTYLPYDLLVKEDRATMAHSVESRVPMLDLELLDIAERMPDRQLISLLAGKRPLRELANRRIGRSSIVKRGFAMPLGSLLAGPWADEATSWLHESGSTLVDSKRIAEAHRTQDLEPLDVWALSTLIAWEHRLASAGRVAQQPATTGGDSLSA